MGAKRKIEERRVKNRVSVNETILAIRANKPGRVVDISKGGIAFEYREGDEWPDGFLDMDVLYGEEDYYVDRLPVDTVTESVFHSNCSLSPARRRGLRFGDLTPKQEEQLDTFIRINSTCKKHTRRS